MLAAGERVGSYELRAVLGRGSYGTVYLAWDDDHSREVAAKALEPSLVAAPEFLARFRTEASVLAGISHPNVVAVLDYVEDQRGAWLITEYVHGTSLAAVLARAGTLAPEQALGVLSGALSGLEHVHAKGLVHGDIKPANILVSSDGISKLADFGQTAPSGQRAGVGTAAYISPEAARGEPVDARSDIYSAGVVLYEALTGRLPFAATSELALLRMHVTQPAPRATGLHPRLADLLERMLAKDPAQRPQSVGEVLDELEAAAETAYGAAWRRRAGIEGLIASLIAGAGVLAAGAPAAGAPITLHSSVPSGPPAPPPGGHVARIGATTPHAARRVARTSSRVARTLAAHKTTSGLVATAIVAAAATGALLTNTGHGHTRLASSDAPTINTVNIAGHPGNYTLTISGSGFGSFAGSLPYNGDVPNFRIADSAQIGFGEWGYIGDANQLDYETWTDNKIVVGGLGAAPGDALALAVWNRSSGHGVSWGGNVPPAPSSGPKISSVTFSGSPSSPQIVVRGSGFGEPPAPMPYRGSVQSFVLSDWRAYHAGNGASGTWTSGVSENFKSWSENTIVIDGLGGAYGQAPNVIEPGDPVTIQIWSPASAFDKGPQTAWGGRATFTGTTAHLPGPSGPSAAQVIAHDETVVAAKYGNCAAFAASKCPFAVASTPDASGGSLYAIKLERITGDGCWRGIVYFFDGERLLADTSELAPNSAAGVVALREAETGKFAVDYAVSTSPNTSCAENGNAGTDTYVYGWDGSAMTTVSGTLPAEPRWLVGTKTHPASTPPPTESSATTGSLVNTQSIAPAPVSCGFSNPNAPVTFAAGVVGTIEPATSMSLPAGFSQYLFVGSDGGGSPLSSISWQQDLGVTAAYSGNESIAIGTSQSNSGSFNSGTSTNVAIAGIALRGYTIAQRFSAQTPSADTLALRFTNTAGEIVLLLVGGEGDGLTKTAGTQMSPLIDLTYSECGSNVLASAAVFRSTPPAGTHTVQLTAMTYPTNGGVSLGAVAYVLQKS